MKELIIGLLVLLCGLVVWFLRRPRAIAQDADPSQPNSGWVQSGGAKVAVPNKAKEEWDIREATFLYQTRGLDGNLCYLEANYLPEPKSTSSPFSKFLPPSPPPVAVAIELPDEFLKGIAVKGFPVKRSSECETTAQGIVNRETRQQGGYIFTVSDIFWISPTDVEVSGGLSVGATAGTSKTYYLKKADDQWRVVGEHLKSITCD